MWIYAFILPPYSIHNIHPIHIHCIVPNVPMLCYSLTSLPYFEVKLNQLEKLEAAKAA